MTESIAQTVAAHGEHTTNGVPHGSSSLTPFLTIPRAKEAVEFYRDVFGARVVDVVEMGGNIVHAELDFGEGRLQLGEPNEAYGLVPAPAGDGDCYSIGLYRDDVDAVVKRAEAGGAVIREPLSTFVSGDLFASIRDPFGVRWSVMTRVEDISEEESARRVAAWVQTQADAQK
ncbi:VOC family protein [Alpinimonas psychrophila]|uniref:PhnB protein n=1 Tax=Alpinimonas psychrophila TaxID=748908 RepID=A0A7W3JV58_9MICO|nr:VOC family protein [Alpinimonas psychrophila]MBA8829843.1 PhnB protein [Alpinimonas psychrophila]